MLTKVIMKPNQSRNFAVRTAENLEKTMLEFSEIGLDTWAPCNIFDGIILVAPRQGCVGVVHSSGRETRRRRVRRAVLANVKERKKKKRESEQLKKRSVCACVLRMHDLNMIDQQ